MLYFVRTLNGFKVTTNQQQAIQELHETTNLSDSNLPNRVVPGQHSSHHSSHLRYPTQQTMPTDNIDKRGIDRANDQQNFEEAYARGEI